MKKKFIVFSIIVAMVLSISSIAFASDEYEVQENGKMKYYKTDSDDADYDIKGYVNGKWQSTTFADYGYRTKLIVDEAREKVINIYNDKSKQVVEGVAYEITPSFINNGKYVKLTYTLKNTTTNNKKISLGSYVDVQISGNDKATVERFDGGNGLRLIDTKSNLMFSFYGKSVVGTTDVDRLWVGQYSDYSTGGEGSYKDHCFDNNDRNRIEEKDSAFCYSWIDRTILPGETKTYSVIIGMGEVSNAPRIELDENQGSCFAKNDVKIKGKVSDVDPNSKVSVHYQIDDGDEENTEEMTLVNNSKDFTLDFSQKNLTPGEHSVKIWAIDESGNPSEIITKTILISSLNAPVINMSEEWSKDPVSFTITDTANEPTDVSKYQYKLGSGNWTDVELETSVVALSENGTIDVYAKVIGTTPGDEVVSEVKVAKVDKVGPTITITESNKKVKITAVDNESGVKKVQYAFSTSQEASESLTYTDYSNEFEYTGNETGDLYIHVISIDNLENESKESKLYKKPVPGKVEAVTNEENTYKIVDENNQAANGYTFQVRENNGEWKTVNPNENIRIENPVGGQNIIETRTIDPLGRESEIARGTVISTNDPTTAKKDIPQTGVKTMLGFVLISGIACAVLYFKNRKYKDIK